MISAEVIADSIGPSRIRLTTLSLKYPRFIHAEFMTHRVFSRNASSSRAIPFKKQVEMIRAELAKPSTWLSNKPGMQGGTEIDEIKKAELYWTTAAELAIEQAELLHDLGLHKQHVNRLLEPFSHISVVVTATDWSNFFALRHHHMAQPEIKILAEKMWQAMNQSVPKKLHIGEWHTPYWTGLADELAVSSYEDPAIALKISVARCARVSYNKHDGTPATVEEDLKLYDRLLGSQPIHASPAEHQAMAIGDKTVRSGNLRGWVQYRKTLEGENVSEFSPGMFSEKD